MLNETNGSIWDYLEQLYTIIIPTNCIGVMGAGLAKQARDKYPGLEDDYKHMIKRSNELGMPHGSKPYTPLSFSDVILVPTKYHWKKPADLGLIERGFRELVKIAGPWSGHYAIPEMGCGLGGLTWEQVAPLYDVFKDIPAEFLVVHPVKASEPTPENKGEVNAL